MTEALKEVPARLKALRDTLLAGLVERDVAIRLALLAALAGEHLLLLGPPGTAKSLVARRLHLAFAGASYFERLLTRFTVPEELFGPLSIKGLEEDRYERLTGSYLPTASIAFLDEIFKANSAILNALLTLLNEREFDNGSVRTKTPLIAVVGASNELPEDGELDALFDRFLLRLHVGPVSAAAFPTLLALRGEAVPELSAALRWSVAEIAALHRAAEQVVVDGDVVALLCALREWCAAENIAVSDRRWRKVIKLLQISAITNGRAQVSVWDCWLLQHCVWSTPEQRVKIHEWYESRVGASAAMDPSRLTRIVVSWEAKLKVDQDSRSQMRDEKGQLLYRGADGKPTPNTKSVVQMQRGSERLFLAPEGTGPIEQCADDRPRVLEEVLDELILSGIARRPGACRLDRPRRTASRELPPWCHHVAEFAALPRVGAADRALKSAHTDGSCGAERRQFGDGDQALVRGRQDRCDRRLQLLGARRRGREDLPQIDECGV